MRVRKGFTLMEMLIVMGLMSLVIVFLGIFVSRNWNNYRVQNQMSFDQQKASSVLREFELSARAASELLTVNQNELKFYKFFDLGSSYPDQVRYFVDGNKFKVGITHPAGTALNITYPSGSEEVRLVIDGVVNTGQLFKYYDGNNNQLNAPVSPFGVRMIGLTIRIDPNGPKPPGVMGVSTKVNLRNMKDNL